MKTKALALVFALISLALGARLIEIKAHPAAFVSGLSAEAQDTVFVSLSSERF